VLKLQLERDAIKDYFFFLAKTESLFRASFQLLFISFVKPGNPY
jgi:hypothetical protein